MNDFPVADDEIDMGAAELVAELAFVGVAEHDEIGAVVGFELACIAVAEELGGVGGAGGDGFGGGDAEVADGQCDGHGHGEAGGRAGVGVGGDDEGAAGVDECFSVGVAGIDMEARAGEHHACGSGLCQVFEGFGCAGFEVIDA